MSSFAYRIGTHSVARGLLPLAILVFCGIALADRLSPDVWITLPSYLSSVSALDWFGALVLTAISFAAIGRYDDVAHRHFENDIPSHHARRTGMAAIAVAQTLGFGLITGAVCRWRLLSHLSLSASLALSAFVSVSFVAALAIVTAMACLVFPSPDWTTLPAIFVLILLPVGFIALLRWPTLRIRTRTWRLPNLRTSGNFLGWAFLDTAAAATALWLFLPAGADITLFALFPIFLIGLCAALVCNTPGGLGPFELMMIAAFPHVGADALLQSIIAFRIVYYAVPACLAVLVLLRPIPQRSVRAPDEAPADIAADAPRSEVAIVAQNGGRLSVTPGSVVALWSTPQTMTALFAPVQGTVAKGLDHVRSEADRTGRIPLFYKCDGRGAVIARRRGWSVLQIAEDALLHPGSFSEETPARRTLRRKLRASVRAGVKVTVPEHLPYDTLAWLDATWRTRRRARGGTMGRYTADHVARQWVALAYVDTRPVAFVSFFTSSLEWSLDLVRHTPDAPDGTMHTLVSHAIAAARDANVPVLSLAGVPASAPIRPVLVHRGYQRYLAHAGHGGLRQFKSTFAPRWSPRYAAAPNAFSLAVGLADVAFEVHVRD